MFGDTKTTYSAYWDDDTVNFEYDKYVMDASGTVLLWP